jgi:peptidoglycan hydrolase-like protein with peptidoglycan-binding domain
VDRLPSHRLLQLVRCQRLDWHSDEANYGYTVYDLTHGYKNYLAGLKKTKTLEDATHLAHREYETPQMYLMAVSAAIRPGCAMPNAPSQVQAANHPQGQRPLPARSTASDLDQALLAQAAITRIIQHALGLKVDGDYGSATREAVRAYLKEK